MRGGGRRRVHKRTCIHGCDCLERHAQTSGCKRCLDLSLNTKSLPTSHAKRNIASLSLSLSPFFSIIFPLFFPELTGGTLMSSLVTDWIVTAGVQVGAARDLSCKEGDKTVGYNTTCPCSGLQLYDGSTTATSRPSVLPM